MTAFKRVIPALDLKDGRVVSGVKFGNFKDSGDPVELAQRYSGEGADELYLLDITATLEGRGVMVDVVRDIVHRTDVPLVVAGGMSSVEIMRGILDAGAAKVCLGSAAVKQPDLIRQGADAFGSEAIVLSIDCARRRHDDGAVWWEVVTRGGREPMGLDLISWAEKSQSLGAGELLLNCMDTDGVRKGYDNEMNLAVSSRVDIPIIASGGAGDLQHLVDGILVGGADAVLAASIFHFGHFTIKEAKTYLAAHGISVRL